MLKATLKPYDNASALSARQASEMVNRINKTPLHCDNTDHWDKLTEVEISFNPEDPFVKVASYCCEDFKAKVLREIPTP